MTTADCVIAFSFGSRQEAHAIVPGPVNVALAEYLHTHLGATPKILQWEIDVAYRSLASTHEETVCIDRNTHRPGRYLDSRNVAAQARRAMIAHEWRSALVVAHTDHMERAVACCMKLGIVVVPPPAPLPSLYDSKSKQFWTRGRRVFAMRERLANPVYRLLGYR